MTDVYVFDGSGGDEERARRGAQRAAERASVWARYAQHLVAVAGIDELTAELVMSALFDHYDADGRPCLRGTHPTLPSVREHGYDLGFDCPCTWDAMRRASEPRPMTWWEQWRDNPEAKALRARHDAELSEVATWMDRQPGVEAVQLSWAAPEQWEGVVDGHSFYFRERHGRWRLELDLEPDGEVATQLIGVGDDGELLTESVEQRSGTVIASGVQSALGATPLDHLAFIVRTIRDHLTQPTCTHTGAVNFCPTCGTQATA